MKAKFLIRTLGVFAFCLGATLFYTNKSSEMNTDMFLDSDNVAYASGYTCKPNYRFNCAIPGNMVIGYVRWYGGPSGDDGISDNAQ